MKTNIFILIFMAALCSLAWPASPKEFEITVYVAESAHTPDIVQSVAESTAYVLFDRIDVSLRFIHREPPPADTEAIALHILERAPRRLEPHVLGSAWVAREHPEVNIFRDRLQLFYSAADVRETGVLQGYAIAHELGHVLRADPGHSPAGVMRACWRQADVLSMLQGAVRFCPADAERIHEVLSERRWEGRARHASSESFGR